MKLVLTSLLEELNSRCELTTCNHECTLPDTSRLLMISGVMRMDAPFILVTGVWSCYLPRVSSQQ